MTERVTIEIDEHVAEVVLNRPDRHNCIDRAMFEALGEAGANLANDTSVRAVVLRGAGESFCAGLDVNMLTSDESLVTEATMRPLPATPANVYQRAAYVWREIPVPVICAVTGVAYGGGTQIALGADLRYAHPESRWSIMEIEWGLIPDLGITTTLRHVMPIDRIKELAWTGRVVDGAEALRLGLVTAVHDDPVDAARATARQIAARSPDAIRAMKRLFNDSWHLSEADSLALEAALQMQVVTGRNQSEAVKANFEKRRPVFED
jgi:enoyl-CoA hydratase/carnithine racemase